MDHYPDRPLMPHEIDQREASFREEFNRKRPAGEQPWPLFIRTLYKMSARSYLRRLRKGENASDAIFAATSVTMIKFGALLGCLLTLTTIGVAANLWNSTKVLGLPGTVVSFVGGIFLVWLLSGSLWKGGRRLWNGVKTRAQKASGPDNDSEAS